MHNKLIIKVLGGGNFGSSKLTSNHRVLIKGRIAAWIQALIFVLFAFSENPMEIDYKTQISAHEWAISEAYQRVGNLTLDVDAGAVYCQFTADSVYFNVEKTVTEIDEEGKILHTSTQLSPYGNYAYTIKNDQITIDNQTFKMTSKDQSILLENEKWRLLLIDK